MKTFWSDLKVLYHLALRPVRGGNHAQRMEHFYCGQADHYDRFRERLLRGREELYTSISLPENGVWVDLGGGTGSNLERLNNSRLRNLSQVFVVDLSASLLGVASRRARERSWTNVRTVQDDATTFRPPMAADVVTFSYALTMIPDWYAAIENAQAMLKPGGSIGVVDFYVSRKYPAHGMARHRWPTRTFWPAWFGADNVFPSPDHLPMLRSRFETVALREDRSKVPYLPFVRVPFYIFLGRKPTPGK